MFRREWRRQVDGARKRLGASTLLRIPAEGQDGAQRESFQLAGPGIVPTDMRPLVPLVGGVQLRSRCSEVVASGARPLPTIRGVRRLGPGSTNVWVLPADVTAAGLARHCVDDACAGMPQEKVDVARLLVTELVTNALQHGSGTVVLLVARDGIRVRVCVDDESPDLPVVVEPRQPWPGHGAGMRLVASLADRWGVAPRDEGEPGKRVWFALD